MKQENNKFISNTKKKILCGILFFVIAILSIIAIIATNKDFSFSKFLDFIFHANSFWLVLAILSVIFYILCEGWSITSLCKAFGHKGKKSDGFFYSAADIYFSAITPSASGGQPASAYFMYKDGLTAPVITVSLLYTLLMYSISIISINIITFIIKPTIFLQFSLLAKIFIFIGLFSQMALIFLYYSLLYKKDLLYKICNFFLKMFAKLRLIKNKEEKMEKLKKTMEKYQECAKLLKGKKKILLKSFFFNFLQRIFQIGIIVFVFLASFGEMNNAFSIWSIECLVILGAYCAPIPGAIGVTDYLMLNGFKTLMPYEQAIHLELLSRGLSFYCCILLCGIAVLIKYYLLKRSSKK